MEEAFDILGISENATLEQIRHRYKELALQWHPDKQHGSTKRFQEIQQAYQLICTKFTSAPQPPSHKTRKRTHALRVTLADLLYGNKKQVAIGPDLFEIEIPPGVEDGSIEVFEELGIRIQFSYDLPTNCIVQPPFIYIHHEITLQEVLCGFDHEVLIGGKLHRIHRAAYYNPQEPYRIEGTDIILLFHVIYPLMGSVEEWLLRRARNLFCKLFSGTNPKKTIRGNTH